MSSLAHKTWISSVMPAVIVPNAVGDAAPLVRATLEHAKYTRYALLDRASYELVENPAIPEIVEALVGIASEVTGRPLEHRSHRAMRLSPGDYVLSSHDRLYEGRPVELVLDLSEAVVPHAEVHYRHRGQVYFVAPSMPGSLALIERGPTVTCNHTYLSLRNAGSVVRLMMLLATRAD